MSYNFFLACCELHVNFSSTCNKLYMILLKFLMHFSRLSNLLQNFYDYQWEAFPPKVIYIFYVYLFELRHLYHSNVSKNFKILFVNTNHESSLSVFYVFLNKGQTERYIFRHNQNYSNFKPTKTNLTQSSHNTHVAQQLGCDWG